MENKMKFGQFIAKKRKEQQLTQKEFASSLFVTESAVSKWERGISYPDISLVSEICRVLQITEHELITASEDYHQRQLEKRGNYFLNIVKTYSAILYGAYIISLLTCLIVNFALEHKLDWFYIVLSAEMLAFSLLNLPLIVKERKGLFTVLGSFISINLLLFVCSWYTGGDWFAVTFVCLLTFYALVFLPLILRAEMKPIGLGKSKALICLIIDTILIYITVIVCMLFSGSMGIQNVLEIAIPLVSIGIILPWIYLLIIRYIRWNNFYKAAICLSISGVYFYMFNSFVHMIIDKKEFSMPAINLTVWNNTYINGNVGLITFMSTILLSIVFTIAGIMYSQKKEHNGFFFRKLI
ncbi:helix-turn-helix transcriptional regulator [Ureibacillus sp. Re31]|uniref:Helix-turn-helix transcriptional regulator n=1 Tax=Ureibacillus galli TaxID=2762222 RepID=A0ABR8XGM1_9BACL|nr:helix-turn-helix transcriptional regulator [Ureibacillus galli]MBD8028380.1 helix-turn-helix transcriptional regulator [Ureibacillus galli]